jgi:hypothetical protein
MGVRDWKVGKGGAGGKGKEMTQTLYAHMNKRKKKRKYPIQKMASRGAQVVEHLLSKCEALI